MKDKDIDEFSVRIHDSDGLPFVNNKGNANFMRKLNPDEIRTRNTPKVDFFFAFRTKKFYILGMAEFWENKARDVFSMTSETK